MAHGATISGFYDIDPDGDSDGDAFLVECDFESGTTNIFICFNGIKFNYATT